MASTRRVDKNGGAECKFYTRMVQVVAILAAGSELPFSVESVKLDLPELQVCVPRLIGR